MLKASDHKLVKANGRKFAIVASTYNAKYVDSMLKAAELFLTRAGSKKVRVVRVPGAYEIPVVSAKLAASRKYDAIICLGVIIRGATTHAQHIGEAVSQALANIQVQYLTPVIHEVLLLENEQQATERCLNPQKNRGVEAAGTAVRMAVIMDEL